MFCGSNHIFCVSVTPKMRAVEWYEEYKYDEATWYIPKRSGFEWEFELPVFRTVAIRVKTLFRAETRHHLCVCFGVG